MIRPSVGWTAEVLKVIWVSPKQEYFCERDWTGQIRLILLNKLRFARNAIRASSDGGRCVSSVSALSGLNAFDQARDVTSQIPC
jgi:hypothetical protein